jgi:carboxyl-terminal processing protease
MKMTRWKRIGDDFFDLAVLRESGYYPPGQVKSGRFAWTMRAVVRSRRELGELTTHFGGSKGRNRMAFLADMRRFGRPVRFAAWGFASLVMGVSLTGMLCAELQGPTAVDRRIAMSVANELRTEHLLRHPIDDEISQRAFKIFLDQLDGMKVYFLKSDIAEFKVYEKQLDEMVRGGDVRAAYVIYNRFLQRVDATIPWIEEYLHAQHDFTVDEELPTDPETIDYAADEAALKDRWRRRIKFELLRERYDLAHPQKVASSGAATGAIDQPAAPTETAPATDMNKAIDKLSRRFASLAKRRHQIKSEDLLELFLNSITMSFDPHTSYMSNRTLENFDIQMRLNLEGIGAALQFEDGYTVVSNIIPGGPADKMGKLKAKDRIVSVGQGTEGEMVDVVDMMLDDVVKLIRGHSGTIVRLGVLPHDGSDKTIYTFTRARVELKDSEARSEIVEEGKKPDGTPYRLGVIDLPSFYMDMEGARMGLDDYKSTTRDVRKILEQFSAKGVDAVILDLRRNGGGSLTEAISLTGLFIDRGTVVQVRDSSGLVQRHNDMEPGVSWSGPLVVLCGKFSASASEILAGAIQDYQRGIVVGDVSTHGKGTVQSMVDLAGKLFQTPARPDYGALKITIQQFYRPNGESTQKRGVLSDIVLPSFTTHMEGVGEDDLDYAVEFDQVKPSAFSKYGLVSQDIVNELRTRSTSRVQTAKEFQKLSSDIEKYLEQREQKTVTLNEAKYAQRRQELDADSEDQKQFEDQMEHSTRQVFEKDYYNSEVLAVTLDYLELLSGRQLAQVQPK